MLDEATITRPHSDLGKTGLMKIWTTSEPSTGRPAHSRHARLLKKRPSPLGLCGVPPLLMAGLTARHGHSSTQGMDRTAGSESAMDSRGSS
jgi:hypothetical protein